MTSHDNIVPNVPNAGAHTPVVICPECNSTQIRFWRAYGRFRERWEYYQGTGGRSGAYIQKVCEDCNYEWREGIYYWGGGPR